jgi:hypothetical protein
MNFAEIRTIMSNIEYKDWAFNIGITNDGADESKDRFWIQVQFETVNCVTGESYIAKGRKWLLSRHMVKSEIVGTAM